MAPPIPPEASKEIEQIRSLVARHFPVYDIRVTYDVVEFFVRAAPETLEENFEALRAEMAQQNYIPMITYERGEHIITVAKKPVMKFRGITVNLAMLVVTFLTTILAGTLEWAGYSSVPSSQTFAPDTILSGTIVFALPLMSILGVHELAHYFMARRRNVAASLPFFIPSIPPLGTFGAFISLREPIPNKKTLLEIGVAGPLAGLALAIPLGILGLMLTNDGAKLAPENIPAGGALGLIFPLIYQGLEQLFPLKGDFILHPTAFAAWVGFLVTALNLLPVGQLDGGHVARALFGSKSRYLSWATIAILVGLGFFYLGWLLFAVLILFLGARHPPPLNDITKLDVKRKAVGFFTFVVLVIAFSPLPLVSIPADYSFEMTPTGSTNASLAAGESHTFIVFVDNIGNALNDVTISLESGPIGWTVQFKQSFQVATSFGAPYSVSLNSTQNTSIDVLVTAPASSLVGGVNTITVKGTSENKTSISHEVTFNLTLSSPAFAHWIVNNNTAISPGSWGNVTVRINNTGPVQLNLTLNDSSGPPSPVYALLRVGTSNTTGPVDLTVPANGNSTFYVEIYVLPSTPAGSRTVNIDVLYHQINVDTITIGLMVG